MAGVTHDAIPDGGTETQQTQSPLPAGTAAAVSITWSHEYPPDLRFYLVAPSGAELKLFGSMGGIHEVTDAMVRFSDQGRSHVVTDPTQEGPWDPEGGSLASLGTQSAGVWQLKAEDAHSSDDGDLPPR